MIDQKKLKQNRKQEKKQILLTSDVPMFRTWIKTATQERYVTIDREVIWIDNKPTDELLHIVLFSVESQEERAIKANDFKKLADTGKLVLKPISK